MQQASGEINEVQKQNPGGDVNTLAPSDEANGLEKIVEDAGSVELAQIEPQKTQLEILNNKLFAENEKLQKLTEAVKNAENDYKGKQAAADNAKKAYKDAKDEKWNEDDTTNLALATKKKDLKEEMEKAALEANNALNAKKVAEQELSSSKSAIIYEINEINKQIKFEEILEELRNGVQMSKLDALLTHNMALFNENQLKDERIINLDEEKSQKEKEILELQNDINDKKTAIQDLQQEKAKEEEGKTKALEESQQKALAITALEQQKNQEIQAKEEQITQLEQAIIELQAGKEQLIKDEAANLNKKNAKAGEKNQQLEEIIKYLKNVVYIQEKSIKSLQENKTLEKDQYSDEENTELSIYKEKIQSFIQDKVKHAVDLEKAKAEKQIAIQTLENQYRKETANLSIKIFELNKQMETASDQSQQALTKQKEALEKAQKDLEQAHNKEKATLEQAKDTLNKSVQDLKTQIKNLKTEKQQMKTSLDTANEIRGGLAPVVFSSFKTLAGKHDLKDDKLVQHIMAALTVMNNSRSENNKINVRPESCIAFVKMLKIQSLDKLDNGCVVQAKAFLRQVCRVFPPFLLARLVYLVMSRDIGNTFWHLWQSQKELNDRTVECATAIGANIDELIAAVEVQITQGLKASEQNESNEKIDGKKNKTEKIKVNQQQLEVQDGEKNKTEKIAKSGEEQLELAAKDKENLGEIQDNGKQSGTHVENLEAQENNSKKIVFNAI